MATWVWLSLGGAFLQNLRSSVQKRLTGRLSTGGAAATRFLYGLPFAALWLAALALVGDAPPPLPNGRFFGFVLGGSLAQIAGTLCLLATFSRRSFAVGTTYSKTEGIQTALFGWVLLGDTVGPLGLVGIGLTVAGVVFVSRARAGPRPAGSGVGPGGGSGGGPGRGGDATTALGRREAIGLGLLSGAMFALSAVGYRGASLALGDGDFLRRAALTLAVALAIQSVVMAVGLRLREPGELTRVAGAWRAGVLAGAAGAAASACWFTAFTLIGAAYVKAVGSIELAFALLTSWLVFGERPTRAEIGGIALVAAGVVVTVLSR